MPQKNMQQWLCQNLEEVPMIAQQILEIISQPGRVLLEGNLGAGKTTWVQQFIKILGCDETVSSPTYSLINLHDGGRIAHMDLYRVENVQELEVLGLDELGTQWEFIEWGLQFSKELRPIAATLYLRETHEPGQRLVTLELAE